MNLSIPRRFDDLSEDRLLRAADVQAQLGMSRAKVYRLMQHNILPTVRIGGSVRVPRKALSSGSKSIRRRAGGRNPESTY